MRAVSEYSEIASRLWQRDRDRIGQILTAIGGGLLFIILGIWLFAQVTGAVALTIAQLPVMLVMILIGTVASGIVALAATAVNGWQLRDPRSDRGLATFLSGATLIVVLLFLFVTLLPHLRVGQFAQGFQHACGDPLTSIAHDIGAADDAVKQTAGNDSDFVAATAKYAAIFQRDGAAIPQQIAHLKALSVPDQQYQHDIDDCAAEMQAVATFLVGTNGVTLPTIIPPPLGGMSLSAQSLLTLAGSAVSGTLSGIPQLSAFLVSTIVTLILDAVPTTCDTTCQNLKADGTQLEAAVFAPFKVKS